MDVDASEQAHHQRMVSNNRLRHEDEVWESELAEEAHERLGPSEAAGRLRHHLDALRRRYKNHTPQHLPVDRLPAHAVYLRDRYKHIASLVLRMIAAAGDQHALASMAVRHTPDHRPYFSSAALSHRAIAAEMREVRRYWKHVAQHGRLPYRCAPWLGRYNARPIAHPWEHVDAGTLDCLAEISSELERRNG